MTDSTTDAPETLPTEGPEPEPVTDWKAEAEKLKAESRKWESRAKDNAKAAQRLAEFEEAQKTELQKAAERAEKAEKQLQQLESERQIAGWKAEVADATGIPVAALRGSTREELQAHADELKPLLDQSRRGPYVPTPGDMPTTPASDERTFVRQLFGSH